MEVKSEGVERFFKEALEDVMSGSPKTDELEEVTIDTCFPSDTHIWETGIERDGEWTIVEQYESKEAAIAGHAHWVEVIMALRSLKHHKKKLVDLDLYSCSMSQMDREQAGEEQDGNSRQR